MRAYCTDIARQTILIDGVRYSGREIRERAGGMPAAAPDFRQELFSFLAGFYLRRPRILSIASLIKVLALQGRRKISV